MKLSLTKILYLIFLISFYYSCSGDGNGEEDAEEDQVTEATDAQDGAEDPVVDTPQDPATEEGPGEDGLDAVDLLPDEGDGQDVLEDTPVEGDMEEEEIIEETERLALTFLPVVLEMQVEGGQVEVGCLYLAPDGTVLPPPPDLEISTTAADAAIDGTSYRFEDIGEKEFVCRSPSLALETHDFAVVAFEGLNRGFIRVSDFVSYTHQAGRELLASIDVDDEVTYEARISEMRGLQEMIDEGYYNGYSYFVDHPLGWPTRGRMESAGFTTGSDDARYEALIGELSGNLLRLRNEWDSLDPHSLETTVIDNVARISLDVKENIEELGTLNPSEIWIMESGPLMTSLIHGRLVPLQRLSSEKMTEALYWYGPSGGGGGERTKMTLSSMLVGLAINYILDQLPSYKKLLKDAGKAAASSALMLWLASVLDRYYVALPGDPVFDSAHGPWAGSLNPGTPWTAVGNNFNSNVYKNQAIFLPPVVAETFVNAIFDIISACDGMLSDPNILLRVKQLHDLINTIGNTSIYYGYSPMTILLVPESVDAWSDPEFMEFGPLPTGVNPSMFPVAGILIPVNKDTGRGPTLTVNVFSG